MSDLISRQAAIDAIEARETEQWIESDVDYNNGLESAVAEVNALPSADEVEIVRCKDCKWYDPLDDERKYDCFNGLHGVMKNDFCSKGKRREQTNEHD